MKDKYRTYIRCCWGVLLFYFIIKLCGGNWFEIACENERFIAICDYLDNSWLKYLISTIIYIPSTYLVYLSMVKKQLFNDWWFIIVISPLSFLKAKFKIIGGIIELLIILFVPLIVRKFKNWKRVLLGIVLVISFQAISLFIRNISNMYVNTESTLVSYILSIDYYIMVVLYYLYANKERREN